MCVVMSTQCVMCVNPMCRDVNPMCRDVNPIRCHVNPRCVAAAAAAAAAAPRLVARQQPLEADEAQELDEAHQPQQLHQLLRHGIYPCHLVKIPFKSTHIGSVHQMSSINTVPCQLYVLTRESSVHLDGWAPGK